MIDAELERQYRKALAYVRKLFATARRRDGQRWRQLKKELVK
jgi:hypothetical protein